jgi:hypothetical protein
VFAEMRTPLLSRKNSPSPFAEIPCKPLQGGGTGSNPVGLLVYVLVSDMDDSRRWVIGSLCQHFCQQTVCCQPVEEPLPAFGMRGVEVSYERGERVDDDRLIPLWLAPSPVTAKPVARPDR